MEHNELKPCPFCGGEAVIDSNTFCAGHGDFITRFQIRCRKCRKRGKVIYNYDGDDALRKEIERWNTSVKKTDIKTVEKCELNREQTIKGLQEIVDNYSGSWKSFNALDNALSLIKELTEGIKSRDDTISRFIETMPLVKADTVRKMQEMVYEFADDLNTIDAYIIKEMIDQIAKEIIEGETK